MSMGVIKVDFRKSELRADVVAEQFNLETAYLKVLQILNVVSSKANESRKQLNELEKEELCRRLRVVGEDWLADAISQ